MATVQDFSNEVRPTWCPGCGDYGIWNAFKRAFAASGYGPDEIMMVTGIGCGSKMNDYMHISGLHTLHGRTLAVATGFKLANSAMKVICVHGDGDGYGEVEFRASAFRPFVSQDQDVALFTHHLTNAPIPA